MPANLAIMYNKKLRKIIWEGEVFIINLTSSPSCNTESTNLPTAFCAKNGKWNQPNTQLCYFLPYGVNKEIHNKAAWSLSITLCKSITTFKLKIYVYSKKLLSTGGPVNSISQSPRVLQKLLLKSTVGNQSFEKILHSFPSPRDLPHPGNEPGSLALLTDSLPSEPPRKPSSYLLKCNRLCQNIVSSNNLLFFLTFFG